MGSLARSEARVSEHLSIEAAIDLAERAGLSSDLWRGFAWWLINAPGWGRRGNGQPACVDCGVDTVEIGEYAMLRDELWLRVHPDDAGALCIGCVETRLGRCLRRDDFHEHVGCNWDRRRRSARLEERLAR
jgi:hypothetical protein